VSTGAKLDSCCTVLVPYRDRAELTCSLLDQLVLGGGFDQLLLYDNGSTPQTADQIAERLEWLGLDHKAEVVASPERNLTEMWNDGWARALDAAGERHCDLAIFNNDLRIPDGFLIELRRALRSDEKLWAICPDWHRRVAEGTAITAVRSVRGTMRHGGMCGWAFVVKAEARHHGLAPIDEQFEWWCGDDDLAFAIEAAGYQVGLLQGLPLDHVGGGSQTFDSRHEIKPVAHADLERCQKKWGR